MTSATGKNMKKQSQAINKQIEVDMTKIFLSPPRRMAERMILLVMLVVTFMIFFGPLQFSEVSPLEAALTAMVPALSISWGWMVWLRYRFRKRDYLK